MNYNDAGSRPPGRLRPRPAPKFDIAHALGYKTGTSTTDDKSFPPVDPASWPVEILCRRLKRLSGSGPTYYACCPAHCDSTPSLSVTECRDGSLLVHCHAGCPTVKVLDALGLNYCHLFPSPWARAHGRRAPHFAALNRRGTYVYTPEADPPSPAMMAELARVHELSLRDLFGARRTLARRLGLPESALTALAVGYDRDQVRWTFPERDSRGRVVGLVHRQANGQKWAVYGSRRCLTIPAARPVSPAGPVYVAEGASDTAALYSVGCLVVGRPARGASPFVLGELASWLRRFPKRDIVVIGDNDDDDVDNNWLASLADALGDRLGRPVDRATPPTRFKDVREQITAGAWAEGLRVTKGENHHG